MIKTEILGPHTLSWPEGVFPLGGDALSLGAFATVRSGWRVCDLGTGSGALLLLLAGRAERLSLAGVDMDSLSAETGVQSPLFPSGQREERRACPKRGNMLAGGAVRHRRAAGEKWGAVCPVPSAGAAGGSDVYPSEVRTGAQADAAGVS